MWPPKKYRRDYSLRPDGLWNVWAYLPEGFWSPDYDPEYFDYFPNAREEYRWVLINVVDRTSCPL